MNWFTKTKKPNEVGWRNQPFRFRFYVMSLEYGRRLKYVWADNKVHIAATTAVLVGLYLLSGCFSDVVKPTDIVEPEDLTEIAEGYCKTDLTLTCGKVYGFPETPAENAIGMLEMCVSWPDNPERPSLAEAEAEFGPSILSPDARFANANLCWWQCPGLRGCNSYNSCYCGPVVVMPDAGVDATPLEVPHPIPLPPKYDGLQ